jgi:hypothetical protein
MGSAGVVVFPLTKGKDVLRVKVDVRTASAEKVLAYGRKSADPRQVFVPGQSIRPPAEGPEWRVAETKSKEPET